MIKIAFIGRQRSGKTTGAEALHHHFLKEGWEGIHVHRTSFGKAMKRHFEHFTGEKFDKKEHRKMIQLFGQLHRHYDENIWVRFVENEMQAIEMNGYSHFIIDDVRQANEVEFCKKNGFILIYVDVPLTDLQKRCEELGEPFTPAHSTEQVEQFYLDADLRIVNEQDCEESFKIWLIDCVEELIQDRGDDDGKA